MKLPAQARKLQETAEAAGWLVTIEEDVGTFRYNYEDGSKRTFHDVPMFRMQIFHVSVMIVVGWIKNPVTGRWVRTNAKPIIVRTKDEDEFANKVEYELNKALGWDIQYWEYWNVKAVIELLESDDADMLAARIQQWGRGDETIDDTD